MSKISDLLVIILYHNDLYSNEDSPEIEDVEYDKLVNDYLTLGGSYEDISNNQASSKFEKIRHVYEVKSLDKIHSEEEVRAALTELAPGEIQPKLDGITMIVYGKGCLSGQNILDAVWATKGNSNGEGERVDANANKIDHLDAIDGIIYRAEVIMPISEFNRINKERDLKGLKLFKNPRNAAAGMIRNLDPDKVEGLTYIAYNIMGSTDNETKQLQTLKDNGITTVSSIPYTKDNIEECVKYIMEYNELYRRTLNYEIDGLVIKSNIDNAINIFGKTGHHNKNAVAFKFDTVGMWVKIKEIVVQPGRTGQLTPVAIFETVQILGSDVSRATLVNQAYIIKLGVTSDCEVYVVKANDIIPKILEVRNAVGDIFLIPGEICPECGKPLTVKGANIFCLNKDCKSNVIGMTNHFAKRDSLDIEDLSILTVTKMYDAGLLKTPYDLFMMSMADLLELDGFAEKSAGTMYRNIRKSRKSPLNKFLYAAGVPLVGRTVSNDISNKLLTLQAIIDDIVSGCKIIGSIDGIGKEITKSLFNNMIMITTLASFVSPISIERQEVVEPLPEEDRLTIVFTGNFTLPQKYFEGIAKLNGHKVASAVSKKTNYLVNNDINSKSSKNEKAKSVGVPIISEEYFMEIMDKKGE